jgi:hypothetical protein
VERVIDSTELQRALAVYIPSIVGFGIEKHVASAVEFNKLDGTIVQDKN